MKILLFGWFLLVSSLSMAQSSSMDVIHKIDRSTVNAKIDELGDTEIIYFETSAPKTKKTISRSQVWKVVFSDGSTEIITTQVGQGVGTDQIVLIDQTIVPGKVTRRDERKLYYTKPNDPANTQYELLLSRLDRIQYADGREEVFQKMAGASTVNPVSSPRQSVETPAPVVDNTSQKRMGTEEYSAPPVSASYRDPQAFARMHLTVGPEFAYYPDFINKDKAWLNDSLGFGMKQNIGASLRFDYRFIKRLAVSVTAGYYGWELVRKYTRDGVSEYSETKKLTQIPVQLGLKIYPFGSFYIMPEGGVNLLMSSVQTSDTHPTPDNESVTSTPITYGASLGYEMGRKGLLLDLSIRYQLLNVNNLRYVNFNQVLNEQVNIASIRLGIGFNSFKK